MEEINVQLIFYIELNYTEFFQPAMIGLYFLQEYDKWQQKVEKLRKKERSGPNIVKLDSVSDGD